MEDQGGETFTHTAQLPAIKGHATINTDNKKPIIPQKVIAEEALS